MLHLPFLYIRPSPLGGRGVFTAEAIAAGTVVELAPVVVLSAEDRQAIHATGLHDYYFVWDGEGAAIALGYGSLYNHSTTPNLDFEMDYDFDQIRFTARMPIAAGQELLIDYVVGGGEEVWF
ncbi:SET domain-containing protein [Lewinella marina]|uniref:SET domain-containing protein-lysine N-methyltransferase n=1 Tax=Neolewinella marina TaxID=438751 RepID=A0A2G0CHJ3_9BACT|nr:SET domain-containing protein [Neolewinella marina]NJB86132.1 SET domain-containing protein [Neolewinella marina]PHK99390.1 SET domain-containing protein-lysine N-methyltransferase [Neolewinella marina]